MATHQDNRPVIGKPPPVFLRKGRRVRCIRISLGAFMLSDSHRPVFPKLLTSSGVVDRGTSVERLAFSFLPSNLPSYVWLNKGIYKYKRKSEDSSGLYSVSGLLAVRIRLGREKINDAMFRTKIVFEAIVA